MTKRTHQEIVEQAIAYLETHRGATLTELRRDTKIWLPAIRHDLELTHRVRLVRTQDPDAMVRLHIYITKLTEEEIEEAKRYY